MKKTKNKKQLMYACIFQERILFCTHWVDQVALKSYNNLKSSKICWFCADCIVPTGMQILSDNSSKKIKLIIDYNATYKYNRYKYESETYNYNQYKCSIRLSSSIRAEINYLPVQLQQTGSCVRVQKKGTSFLNGAVESLDQVRADQDPKTGSPDCRPSFEAQTHQRHRG